MLIIVTLAVFVRGAIPRSLAEERLHLEDYWGGLRKDAVWIERFHGEADAAELSCMLRS